MEKKRNLGSRNFYHTQLKKYLYGNGPFFHWVDAVSAMVARIISHEQLNIADNDN